MTSCKRTKRGKNITIEDLYQNKNFVPPKEKNLETIFEEPKQAKNGAPILTSTRKFKRYLDFDPITGKVQKPKKKGKRCVKKVKGKTRSASKAIQNVDINAVLETLDDLSDECDMDLTYIESEIKDGDNVTKNSIKALPVEDEIANNNSAADETVNNNSDGDETVNNNSDGDEIVNNNVPCKKCVSVEKFCTCELNDSKILENRKRKTRSSYSEACMVT